MTVNHYMTAGAIDLTKDACLSESCHEAKEGVQKKVYSCGDREGMYVRDTLLFRGGTYI